MSNAEPNDRFVACVGAIERAARALDGRETEALLAELGSLAARLRAAAMERAILGQVSGLPGSTSNAIAEHVRGDRVRVLATLRDMAKRGLLRWEPGAKGARLWYAAKDRSGLSTAARQRVR